MKPSAFFLACLGSVMGFAQGHPPHPKVTASPTALIDKRPVTNEEAKAVFARMDQLLWGSLELSTTPPASGLKSSQDPITREQVVQELGRTFQSLKGDIKFTPPSVPFSPTNFSLKDSKAKATAAQLVKWGLIAKVGPIVAGNSKTVAPAVFGDAVGFFIARVCDITHVPSPKWTPYLGAGRN